MEIKFKRLRNTAKRPVRATEGAAAFDLFVSRAESIETEAYEQTDRVIISYHSDIAFEIPSGYMGLLVPRSSVSKTGQLMANSVGVIDSDYRGEVSGRFDVDSRHYVRYSEGERFAQLIIVPVPEVELREATELSYTSRGNGGYGSTGK